MFGPSSYPTSAEMSSSKGLFEPEGDWFSDASMLVVSTHRLRGHTGLFNFNILKLLCGEFLPQHGFCCYFSDKKRFLSIYFPARVAF